MAYKFQLGDARLSGSTVFEQALAGESTISASSTLSGQALTIDSGTAQITKAGAATLASLNNSSGGITNAGSIAGATTIDASGDLTVGSITNAEFTVDSAGNTDIDGTLNVEGVPTFQAAAVFSGGITTANAIAGATTISGSGAISGLSLDVEKGADFNAGGLTNAGAVSGVTTLAASGLMSVASISMDDGSTLGPDSVSDLVTLSADGDITIKDGAYDFNIAAHDGTNGLALGGTIVGASANELNYNQGVTAGTAGATATVVLDAAKDITGINNLTASYFSGNGSGITNINVENLDAAGSDTQVQFNQNGEFAGAAGFTFDGTGSVATSVLLSSADLKATNLVAGRLPLVSTAGLLDDVARIGYSTSRAAQLGGRDGLIVSSSASGSAYMLEGYFSAYDTSQDLIWDLSSAQMRSRVSLDISGSDSGADDVGLTVSSKMDGGASITGVGHIGVGASGTFEAMMFSTGVVSGSDAGKFESLQIDSTEVISSARAVSNVTSVAMAGALSGVTTVGASGLASLDGGINTNDDFTVDTDGNVVGVAGTFSGLASLDGGINVNDDFTVNTDGAVVAVGINAGGALSGVTTLAASGLASVASISMDDGSTLGPDSVADLVTFSAAGDITVKDGAYDFDIAAHDGTNGLKLGGVLVDASAADLNFTNVAAAGTAEASKALVLDAAKDITGINNLTASYFSGNGSGLTNIDASSISAAGSDKFLQFNQDGDFAGNAGLQYSGTGSVVISGSSSGFQSGELVFGTTGTKYGSLTVEEDDGYLFVMKNPNGGIDLSASDGIAAFIPDGLGFHIGNAMNMNFQFDLMDVNDESVVAYMSGSGAISGSGNFNIGGTLNADNLGNATVDLTADLMIIDDGASGAIKSTSLAQYATAIAGAGLAATAGALGVGAADESVTVDADALKVNRAVNGGLDVTGSGGTGGLKLSGSALVDGDFTHGSWYNDTFMFVDVNDRQASDGAAYLKKTTFATLATKLAGTGITATNGVLSLSQTSTPTAFASYATLVEGLNYQNSTALTGAMALTLPAASALDNGEFVKIKLAAGASSSNLVTINVGDASDTIDGESSIVLESPYAAVNLYRVAANTWRIL